MAYESLQCLKVRCEDGVATVTIDHPPINLFDGTLIADMLSLIGELSCDAAVRVVVFESANPEFFIAHADVSLIAGLPSGGEKPSELPFVHQMMEQFRTMPKVTIGKIEGRARGAGSELLMSLDMRFGAIGKALLGQPEVALGLVPGAGGTQRLPRQLGRGRALEVILSCEDFDAELAERYGYINRALPAEEIGPFVDRLAKRIASFPPEAVALAKEAVEAAEPSFREGLLEEAYAFKRALATDAAKARIARFLEGGGQTHDMELDLGPLFEQAASEGL